VWLEIAIFLFGSKDKEWMDWCGHLFDLHGEITQNRIRIKRELVEVLHCFLQSLVPSVAVV
jgi:hypothetical protein